MFNKIVFVNTNMQFKLTQGEKILEGGASRNIAWERKIQTKKNVKIVNIGLDKFHFFKIIFTLLFSFHKRIFILYPSLGIQLYKEGLHRNIVRKIYFTMCKLSSYFNNIIFDISDLKYEQAIDLELKSFNLRVLQKNEEALFSLKNAYFIFASESMMKYAMKKYGLRDSQVCFCNNGGAYNKVTKSVTVNRPIKFVYAGTLNRGRNIERMISLFPDCPEIELYLLGKDGDWIIDYNKKNNVIYLGALSEKDAFDFVAECDIGLIPYDEKKMYYNVAYPTKLSFYITAGIPYLSTPVKEIKKIQDKQLGWSCTMDDWSSFIKMISIEDIRNKKRNVEKNKVFFSWDSTLNNPYI